MPSKQLEPDWPYFLSVLGLLGGGQPVGNLLLKLGSGHAGVGRYQVVQKRRVDTRTSITEIGFLLGFADTNSSRPIS